MKESRSDDFFSEKQIKKSRSEIFFSEKQMKESRSEIFFSESLNKNWHFFPGKCKAVGSIKKPEILKSGVFAIGNVKFTVETGVF